MAPSNTKIILLSVNHMPITLTCDPYVNKDTDLYCIMTSHITVAESLQRLNFSAAHSSSVEAAIVVYFLFK